MARAQIHDHLDTLIKETKRNLANNPSDSMRLNLESLERVRTEFRDSKHERSTGGKITAMMLVVVMGFAALWKLMSPRHRVSH